MSDRSILDNVHQFVALRSSSQILIPIFSNKDAILDSNTANFVIFLKYLLVEELCEWRILEEVSFDILSTEIAKFESDLMHTQSQGEGYLHSRLNRHNHIRLQCLSIPIILGMQQRSLFASNVQPLSHP